MTDDNRPFQLPNALLTATVLTRRQYVVQHVSNLWQNVLLRGVGENQPFGPAWMNVIPDSLRDLCAEFGRGHSLESDRGYALGRQDHRVLQSRKYEPREVHHFLPRTASAAQEQDASAQPEQQDICQGHYPAAWERNSPVTNLSCLQEADVVIVPYDSVGTVKCSAASQPPVCTRCQLQCQGSPQHASGWH